VLSGSDRSAGAGEMMRGDRAAAGQELAGVIEEDDAVAQQAPPLFGVERDGTSRVTVAADSGRTTPAGRWSTARFHAVRTRS